MAKQKPAAEIRVGLVVATIWANTTDDGVVRYNATLSRLYRSKDAWRSSNSFGKDDLLTVAKVADLAHTKVFELEAADRESEQAQLAA